MSVEEILTQIGYDLTNRGNYFTCRANYRQGQNEGSMAIYPDSNLVVDFVEGTKFSIETLISKTLNLGSEHKVKEWLKSKNVIINVEKEPMIETPQIFPETWISELIPDHSYWLNRGISKEVLEEFKGGVCVNSRMKDRYVIGIRDSQNQLIGLQGRTLKDKNPKYKILGCKNEFLFPLHLNTEDIKKKNEIILVEGIGCAFSLFMAGIRNCMVIFGVGLSNQQLTEIIKINPRKIIISTNNDASDGGTAGNEAARKIGSRLLKFFDKRQVEVRLPILKDINLLQTTYGVESVRRMYAN